MNATRKFQTKAVYYMLKEGNPLGLEWAKSHGVEIVEDGSEFRAEFEGYVGHDLTEKDAAQLALENFLGL